MEVNFRKNLRTLLDYEYVSVKELAEMTGIPKRTLENYLGARESLPPIDYAYKIAKALHVSMEYLLTGNDDTYKVPGLNALKHIIHNNREYNHLITDLAKLPDNDIKMILDIMAAVMKNKKIKKN